MQASEYIVHVYVCDVYLYTGELFRVKYVEFSRMRRRA